MPHSVRLSHSSAPDPREAARQLHADLAQPDIALVLFFCSSHYDLPVLGAEITRLFAGVQVVGCTTAGEIGPGGYREHSLSGASFAASAFTAAAGCIAQLDQFKPSEAHALCQRLLQELETKVPGAAPQNCLAFMLIDGLSVREEVVARAFQNALGKVPLLGGSAADGLNFGATYIYFDGSFRSSSAALVLIHTPLAFRVFKTQHFVPTEQRLVITAADPARRVVHEINGFPAAEEYARLVGVDLRNVEPNRFAASPVVVLIDGNNYVRSIQKANSDGSMTFYCAIEEGLVLRVARGVDLIENLERTFAGICSDIGPPQLVLSCDCVLRRLEIVQNHLEERVAGILHRHHAVGFNTYGEQFRGIHVNQTLTGIAIGELPADKLHA